MKNVIGLGKQHNGVYYLITNKSATSISATQQSSELYNMSFGTNVLVIYPYILWSILQDLFLKFLFLLIKFVKFVLCQNKLDFF